MPQFDTPNHQYDTSDFDSSCRRSPTAGAAPALPAVSFLKAPGYQDGHAAYSDPGDEQKFIDDEINALERSPDWSSTAVIVDYDDSDGWYDHVYSGVTNHSLSPADNLTNTTFTVPTSGRCGPAKQFKPPLGGEQGRCGFGPRLPMMLISPFAKQNAVDHNLSDQASIVNFIEYNWHLSPIPGSFDQALASTDHREGVGYDLQGLFRFGGSRAPKLLLNPVTGQPIRH